MPTTKGPVYELLHLPGYTEGYLKALGYWLYFRSFGESGKRGTLLCLHGGPGGSHDFIVPMARLAEEGYRVVMYDQLGCGKSDRPTQKPLYTMERYVEEVETVRLALDLGKVHLYGSSWGAFLAVGYAVKYYQNLESLMLSGGTCSISLCRQEFLKLRSSLPQQIQETLKKFEGLEDYQNEEYLKASEFVDKRHLCRLDPWPPFYRSALERRSAPERNIAYSTMWGDVEYLPVGNLLHWDVTDQLGKIQCPTLITCGEYDEITSENSERLHAGIKNSKMIVFPNCSHDALYEDPERYIRTHSEFLNQNIPNRNVGRGSTSE